MISIRDLANQAGVTEDVLRRLLENAGIGLSDHGPIHAAAVRAFVRKLRRERDVVNTAA
jgi:hypothetical protein